MYMRLHDNNGGKEHIVKLKGYIELFVCGEVVPQLARQLVETRHVFRAAICRMINSVARKSVIIIEPVLGGFRAQPRSYLLRDGGTAPPHRTYNRMKPHTMQQYVRSR